MENIPSHKNGYKKRCPEEESSNAKSSRLPNNI
jgi:hypothetical protein